MTVFSAPDYPQFQCSQDERYNNLGAVAVLEAAGEYCQPRMLQYRAAVRPQVNAALRSCEICAKCTVRLQHAFWGTVLCRCCSNCQLLLPCPRHLHQATTPACCQLCL